MVLEYLKKLEKIFTEERDSCRDTLMELELQLKENQRFIAILEESDDPYYEAFSPRKVKLYQKRKIKDLYDEQKDILSQINQQKEILTEKEDRLSELVDVINFEKQRNY